MHDSPEIRQFRGVVGAGMVWIPLRDPDDDTWWVLSGDGVSYWEGPDRIREFADGLVEEGIDEVDDLMDRIGGGT
jgi:hypothetical protein